MRGGVTVPARCESALGQCHVCFYIVRREVWWIGALPSSADKPGHEEVDTRPEGREVVKMKGGRTGPRRHICHHYSPGACRAWEPYLSPPKNSIPHPSLSIRGALLLAWCLLCLASEHFSPTFFPHLYQAVFDFWSRIFVFSFLSFFFVVLMRLHPGKPCHRAKISSPHWIKYTEPTPKKKPHTHKNTKAWQMCKWCNSESVQLVSVVTH